MSARSWLLLAAVVCLPLPSRADELHPNHWQLGATLQGAFTFHGDALLLTGIASYSVRDNVTVGIEGGRSIAGLTSWRAGLVAQAFFGSEFVRPMAQFRLEALGVQKELSPALGLTFGVSWQPNDVISVIPHVGFDGTFRFSGTSLLEAGVTFEYVVR